MSKYDAPHDFLERIPPGVKERTMAFDEIETILGFELPKSAYIYREWWANPTSPQQHPSLCSIMAFSRLEGRRCKPAR